jgi:transcriptional regulator with XRE-family HTH domain
VDIETQLTDEAILRELGGRLAGLRLARDLTQRQLGERAGVARPAVQRIEAGQPVTTTNLIRVLRALDALDALDRLIPPAAPSPLAELKLRGRQRRRASGAHGSAGAAPERGGGAWKWGDEA